MSKDLVLTFVDYPFYLSDRHIKFFSQWFKVYPIYQSSLQDSSVHLIQDPFIYGILYLCPGIISHFLFTTATLTLPPLFLMVVFLLVAVPFTLDLFRFVAVLLFCFILVDIVYLSIHSCLKHIGITFICNDFCCSR